MAISWIILVGLVCLAIGTWFGYQVGSAPVMPDDEFTGPVSEWSGSKDE